MEVSPLLKALGRRIGELRKKQGYSQESFADACGVHRTFMGAIERGETNISFHNLYRVAEALGITLSHLLSGVERNAAALEKEGKNKKAGRSDLPARS